MNIARLNERSRDLLNKFRCQTLYLGEVVRADFDAIRKARRNYDHDSIMQVGSLLAQGCIPASLLRTIPTEVLGPAFRNLYENPENPGFYLEGEPFVRYVSHIAQYYRPEIPLNVKALLREGEISHKALLAVTFGRRAISLSEPNPTYEYGDILGILKGDSEKLKRLFSIGSILGLPVVAPNSPLRFKYPKDPDRKQKILEVVTDEFQAKSLLELVLPEGKERLLQSIRMMQFSLIHDSADGPLWERFAKVMTERASQTRNIEGELQDAKVYYEQAIRLSANRRYKYN